MVVEIRTLPVCVHSPRYLLSDTSQRLKEENDMEMHKGSEWSVILQKWCVVWVWKWVTQASANFPRRRKIHDVPFQPRHHCFQPGKHPQVYLQESAAEAHSPGH